MAEKKNQITSKGIQGIIETLCASDPRINSYRYSDFFDSDTKEDEIFPLVLHNVDGTTIEEKNGYQFNRWQVSIYCFIQRMEDWTNAVDAASEAQVIVTDLFMKWSNEQLFKDLGFDFSSKQNIQFVNRIGRDDLIGCQLTMSFTTPLHLCLSEIPLGQLPDVGLYYSASTITSNPVYLTCATLTGCSVIQTIQNDIDILYTLTGSTLTGDYLPLSGGTLSGGVYAPYLSGGTIFSGDVDLQTIIENGATYVQDGTNIYTGGTANKPTVNLSDNPYINGTLTANNLVANWGGTITSGATDISEYFTRAGRNLYSFEFRYSNPDFADTETGDGNFKVNNFVDSVTEIYVDYLTHYGLDVQEVINKLRADTLIHIQRKNDPVDDTIYVVSTGATDNSGWFKIPVTTAASKAPQFTTFMDQEIYVMNLYYFGGGDTDTKVSDFTYDGTNTFTITQNDGSTYSVVQDNLGALTISGGTIYSGGTDLIQYFIDITNNYTMSDTQIRQNYLPLSGGTLTGNLYGTTGNFNILQANFIQSYGGVSADYIQLANTLVTPDHSILFRTTGNTVSGTTKVKYQNERFIVSGIADIQNIYSAGTPLQTILGNIQGTPTYVQGGLNTYTGGTATRPTVNVIGSPVFSGTITSNGVDSITLSGGTIYSGDSEITTYVAPRSGRVYLNYTGGSQATTSTSLATVHSSAKIEVPEVGLYDFEFFSTYSAAATTTGAFFTISGTPTFDYLSADVSYTTSTGDRGNNNIGAWDGGTVVASSLFTGAFNTCKISGSIQATSAGDIHLRFASETGGSAITLTALKGFIRRLH